MRCSMVQPGSSMQIFRVHNRFSEAHYLVGEMSTLMWVWIQQGQFQNWLVGWLQSMTIMSDGGESDFGPHSRMSSMCMIQFIPKEVFVVSSLMRSCLNPSTFSKLPALGEWIIDDDNGCDKIPLYTKHLAMSYSAWNSGDIAELHVRSIQYLILFLYTWLMFEQSWFIFDSRYMINFNLISQSQSRRIFIIFHISNTAHTQSWSISEREYFDDWLPREKKQKRNGKPAAWHFWSHILLEGSIADDFTIASSTPILIYLNHASWL